ncbi:hypothetical protein BgiMline_029063 [Biomphalaria glabrata]|uniref:Uncharacterized protein LOC106059334 isoform X1 n=1 Tax=Biomphalaria glabrata TaxID=6526 RepID=A0A9U8E4E7_BIOGL|nr:uncharacterized protein LOC106059334 isoform X1 [Biomphalaria glabrata]XP_013072370.2 uncharacterized protein LOC106059334 isoform X1 [Biomphalaria glabrata]XP_055863754.1 uncharacterized protein LOC106059334 isoform X1 [Biomphalaria glabrata]KAI8737636.1 hypothetical protein BgiMline_025694 [Biomphalaria glabrata]
MSDNPQICSSNTEGLILSSFEVLQDSLSQGNLRQMKLKNAYSTGIDDRLSSRSSQYKQSCLPDDSHPPHMSTHPCVTETNEGDEMFDVTDQFRADEAGDSLDNDTNNNSLDRDDEGDDEEEEDEEEDEVHNVVRQNDGQRLVSTAQDLTSSVETSQQETAPSNLRVHHHPKEAYTSHGSNLPAHNFINSSRALWHSGPTTPNNTARYSGDWHLPLNTSAGERRTDVFSGSSSPDESRDRGCEEQHWKFVHGQTEEQHAHWVPDHGQGKVVVGPVSSNWVGSKRERAQDQTHDLHAIHGHSSMDRSSHWNQHIRTAQADIHTWPKGSVYAPDSEMNNVRSLFTVQPSQSVLATPSASTSYTDIDPARTGSWNLNTHIPAAQSLGNLPRPLLAHEMSCRRASTSGIYQQTPSQSFTGFPGQARADWSASALSPGPSGLTTELPSEHYKLGGVERGPVCKSSIISKRGKGRGIRGESTVEGHPPTTHRPALDQVRQQAHPYQIKDQKKVVRDVYPATSANVHTLKASHIVSWYIDYLIHENEHLTQISRAFSLPVNLFHSDDFYFMDSLKKKVHFPSLKFLSWMQQNLPSINVNAIDFHEGRPPVISTWNQDWFWQNKSRRDIIHDVFFYFQHRRVTCDN